MSQFPFTYISANQILHCFSLLSLINKGQIISDVGMVEGQPNHSISFFNSCAKFQTLTVVSNQRNAHKYGTCLTCDNSSTKNCNCQQSAWSSFWFVSNIMKQLLIYFKYLDNFKSHNERLTNIASIGHIHMTHIMCYQKKIN